MVRFKKYSGILWLWGILALVTLACGGSDSAGPPRNAEVITVWVNSGIQNWMVGMVDRFNIEGVENGDGKQVYVELVVAEAGQAVSQLENAGTPPPTIWIPDDPVWTNIAADKGNNNYQTDCVGIVQSPLVNRHVATDSRVVRLPQS